MPTLTFIEHISSIPYDGRKIHAWVTGADTYDAGYCLDRPDAVPYGGMHCSLLEDYCLDISA